MSAPDKSITRRRITLFLASPSDTARDDVEKIVRKVGKDPEYRERVLLELQRSDDCSQPVPMPSLRCPQGQVEEYKTPAQDCDLVIALFKHRLGTALKDQTKYGVSEITEQTRTGTEWELHQAKAHDIEMWVFRDLTLFVQDPVLNREQREEQQQQYNWVCDYFEHFGEPGHTHRGTSDLSGQFERLLREWLSRKLQEMDEEIPSKQPPSDTKPANTASSVTPLTDLQQSVKDALLAGEKPELDSIAALYRTAISPDNMQSWLLHRWAKWARRVEGVATDAGQLHQHFVTLQLMVDRSRLSEAPPLAQLEGNRWQEKQRYDSLPQLLTDNPGKDGWVLVGPPGSGKSTVLQQYEMHCCVEALRDSDTKAEVCLWFRLSGYNQDSPPPQQWLENNWQQQNSTMPALEQVRAQYRVRFLLDGLNEIRTNSQRARADIVSQWTHWAAEARGDMLPPLFSVRTNEYSDQLSEGEFHASRINLLEWSDEQIERYITKRLASRATDLWNQIKTPELLAFHRLPMTLAHQCELFERFGEPLTERAGMFSGLMWLRLQRLRSQIQEPALLNDNDARKINSEDWRDQAKIHRLPQQGYLIPTLQHLALRMQQRGNEISIPLDDLQTGLDSEQQASWLQAVERLQLAEVEFNDQFRFLHQSWQEYFAARALCQLPQGDGQTIDFAAPEPPDIHETLASLAVADPLPVPPVSRWEETARRLMELLPALGRDQLDGWFDQLRQQNPSLAATAVGMLKTQLDQQRLESLQTELLSRSRDATIDLRIRIKSALALSELGDPRYLQATGPEGHRYLLPKDDYLVTIVDQTAYCEVRLPDGNVGTITLPPFKLSFAPVTRAEYQCFMDAGGYDDPRWWRGRDAQRWFNGEVENTEMPKFWRRFSQDAKKNPAEALQKHYPRASELWKETMYKPFIEFTEPQLNDWLQRTYGAQKHQRPAFWDDPDFSAPCQPVVGVSWFEANAYCAWLSGQTGSVFRLPSKYEWEAAARGPAAGGQSGRPWPWGNSDPDLLQMNADPAHVRKTSPVGVFVTSDTPDGICDMAGNVWEWCSDVDEDYRDNRAEDEEQPGDLRVSRGGCWNHAAQHCRSDSRDFSSASTRGKNSGLRFAQVTQAQQGAERPTGRKG